MSFFFGKTVGCALQGRIFINSLVVHGRHFQKQKWKYRNRNIEIYNIHLLERTKSQIPTIAETALFSFNKNFQALE